MNLTASTLFIIHVMLIERKVHSKTAEPEAEQAEHQRLSPLPNRKQQTAAH